MSLRLLTRPPRDRTPTTEHAKTEREDDVAAAGAKKGILAEVLTLSLIHI